MPMWKRRLPGQLRPLSGGISVSISCCGTRPPCSLQVEGFLLFLPARNSCSSWLCSMKHVALSYSVSGLFWAVQCHTAGAGPTVCELVNNILNGTTVSRKCGVTCWLSLLIPPPPDVTRFISGCFLSGAKWLEQVEKRCFEISVLGGKVSRSWGDSVRGLACWCQNTESSVNSQYLWGRCIICQKTFSCCFRWTRQISPQGIYVSCFQIDGFFTLCSQHLSFQGAGDAVTLGSKEKTCITESANVEKSESLTRWVRLHSVEGARVLEQAFRFSAFLHCASFLPQGPGWHISSVATLRAYVVSFVLAQGPK